MIICRVFKIGKIFLNVGNREIPESGNFQTREFHFFPSREIGKIIYIQLKLKTARFQ